MNRPEAERVKFQSLFPCSSVIGAPAEAVRTQGLSRAPVKLCYPGARALPMSETVSRGGHRKEHTGNVIMNVNVCLYMLYVPSPVPVNYDHDHDELQCTNQARVM